MTMLPSKKIPPWVKQIEKTIKRAQKDRALLTHGLSRSLRQLDKEITIYKNHISHLGTSQNKSQSKHLDVQIGGGIHTLPGYVNIDIFPPADIIYDLREGIPLKNNLTRFIFSEHFLEHIDYPRSVKKFISECHRILEPGGEIVIGVPDAGLMLQNFQDDNKKFYKDMIKRWYSKRDCLDHINTYLDLVNYHFRDQDDSDKYTPHLWSYDYEKLHSLLSDVGFVGIKIWDFDHSIANPKREWGSLYVTAKKKNVTNRKK